MYKTSYATASDFKRKQITDTRAKIYETLKAVDYCDTCKMILPKLHICE